MNFARTNLRNPLACPTVAASRNRLAAAASTALTAPVRPCPLPSVAQSTAAPVPAAESLADQIGAGAMILFFLVLALFG